MLNLFNASFEQFPVLRGWQDRINKRRDDSGLDAKDDAVAVDENAILNSDLFADNGSGADRENTFGELEIASINGSFADVGEVIALDSGALLTVNEDGTFHYDPNGAFDDLLEGETATETFTYQARSTSSPLALDEATVTVTINGVNEPPVITSGASASLAENGTDTGYTATAVDDAGGVISFSITGGADAALFSIDAATGELIFKAAPDFENPGDADGDNAYELEVSATDDGGLSDSQSVTVSVTGVDEPVNFTPPANIDAPENQVFTIFKFNAADPEGEAMTYSLSGADAALFDLDSNTGTLMFKDRQNFEDPDDANNDGDYEITITATGAGETLDRDITVSLTDENDLPYLPDDQELPAAPVENQADFELVTYVAIDEDGDDVTFSLEGEDAEFFTIDPVTGRLATAVAFDHENPQDADGDGWYDYQVIATDSQGGEITLSSITTLVVDVNEAPAITSDALASVAENRTDTGYAATVTDEDEGDSISFSITGGADGGLFSIDSDTGELTFDSAPDFEHPGDSDGDNSYEVEITATDEVGLTDAQTVTVEVVNSNEAPELSWFTVTDGMPEAFTAKGYDLVDVRTADPDAGDTTIFSLSGDDANAFEVDESTGEVTLAGALDFENPTDADGDNVYEYTVVGTDQGGLSDSLSFTLTIHDSNDAPSEAQAPDVIPFARNQADVDCAQFYAQDDDGDSFTYALTGPDADLFNIDPNTGEVTTAVALAGNPDDNGDNIYSIECVVTDEHGASRNIGGVSLVPGPDASGKPTGASTAGADEIAGLLAAEEAGRPGEDALYGAATSVSAGPVEGLDALVSDIHGVSDGADLLLM